VTAALTIVTWFAAGVDNGRGGAWCALAGIAMTTMTAGAVSFASALGLCIVFAGTLDAFIAVAALFFIAFLVLMGVFLAYINATVTGVPARRVAAAMAAQCATLAALILWPSRPAAIAVAAVACAACIYSFVRDRRAGKKRPSV
jgi:hypothetical protein